MRYISGTFKSINDYDDNYSEQYHDQNLEEEGSQNSDPGGKVLFD